MKKETYGGLLWCSRAGVLAQAMAVADERDREHRRHGTLPAACRPHRTRPDHRARGFGMSGPTVALLLTGCVLGVALVATLTA